MTVNINFFFFSSRRRHTKSYGDWSSDVCSSDLGSSWLQSTRIVQRKRRPTSNVDSMMVLRARRGGTGSKYVTLRGGVRRAIPFLLVRSQVGVQGPQFY